MRSLQQYFDLITNVVEHSGAESVEMDVLQRDQVTGRVKGILSFYDGSRLEFTETITIERYRPVKLAYRYQYIRAGEPVFRYDNAAHHPDLLNFPHHKHVGNKKLSVTEPTLSQVLGEVASVLGAGTEPGLPVPTPRRQSRKRKP
ncbi:MAG: toxin-antitoxin system TumE family protein [Candidatus Binatia bacterium]